MPTMLATISFLMLLSPLAVGAEPVTQIIEGKSVSLFTVLYPKENSETIILLHGGPGVPMDFDPIVEVLSKKYQLIVFDQRGTGRSPITNSNYSMDAYVQDINSIAEQLDLLNFHIFGHSWGGLYAQIYAEKFPEKVISLFLSSPSSGTGEQWRKTESEVLEFNKSKTTTWQWLMMGIDSLRGMLGSDSAYQSLFRQVIANYNKGLDVEVSASEEILEQVRADPVNKTRKHILEYPILDSPVSYRFPIVVQYGEEDIYAQSKQHLVERFPEAKISIIKNAGHLAWLNNPHDFNDLLHNFYRLN
ncbi:MAG: alpha/beta hydrolase [Gammaproteobacteria bacterium]|nr:alpha/beta hydrolase [Gammaproteobacteria bacterium]